MNFINDCKLTLTNAWLENPPVNRNMFFLSPYHMSTMIDVAVRSAETDRTEP